MSMFAIVEEEADVDVEAEEEVGLEALVKSEKSEEKTAVRILLSYHLTHLPSQGHCHLSSAS